MDWFGGTLLSEKKPNILLLATYSVISHDFPLDYLPLYRILKPLKDVVDFLESLFLQGIDRVVALVWLPDGTQIPGESKTQATRWVPSGND